MLINQTKIPKPAQHLVESGKCYDLNINWTRPDHLRGPKADITLAVEQACKEYRAQVTKIVAAHSKMLTEQNRQEHEQYVAYLQQRLSDAKPAAQAAIQAQLNNALRRPPKLALVRHAPVADQINAAAAQVAMAHGVRAEFIQKIVLTNTEDDE